jgi:hypothetical protein
MARSYRGRDALDATARLENWSRWGPDDRIGAAPLNVTGGIGSPSNPLALK